MLSRLGETVYHVWPLDPGQHKIFMTVRPQDAVLATSDFGDLRTKFGARQNYGEGLRKLDLQYSLKVEQTGSPLTPITL